jgi:hypothetical protein
MMEPTEPMTRVLERMAGRAPQDGPARIEGVMTKTFTLHADQRGFFIEQLKRGGLRRGRPPPFIPDQPFAQTSRVSPTPAVAIPRSR